MNPFECLRILEYNDVEIPEEIDYPEEPSPDMESLIDYFQSLT